MKKLLVIVAVLAISASSFAQTTFGVKAGVNIANLEASGEGVSMSFDSKTGVIIGGFAKFHLSEAFALQPELLYSQGGAKLGDETFKADYLAIPVMAKYYFGGFNVQAGPQLGFLMTAKAGDEDIKDEMNTTDFGFNIGAGYDLEMGLGFDVRYNMGLSNISKEDADGFKMKNKGFQITASYAF